MKKDVWSKENQDFYVNCLRNIIKTSDGNYELQPVYELVGDEIFESESNKNNPTNKDEKNCYICVHHDSCNNCLIRTKLENLPHNYYIQDHWQNKCDAYTPVHALNIIHSEEEMIEFIEKVENFFDSPESYEWYFGFERAYDEERNEFMETIREYYDRGGKFTNIPGKYPCVIYFSYGDVSNSYFKETDLQWIYIGKGE